MVAKIPNWIRQPLPSWLRQASASESWASINRFHQLTEKRAAPSAEYPKRYVYWPKEPLITRAVPGGSWEWDNDDGAEFYSRLDHFFQTVVQGEIALWGIGAEAQGVFLGRYHHEMRRWIKAELIFSPSIMLASDADLLVIADEQLSYSIIAANAEVIDNLENAFGGREQLKTRFTNWVESQGVGFGGEDRNWAQKYIVPWCGW